MKCYRCNHEVIDNACGCKDGCVIIHGDCREVLPELGPVDLVLADPPYGETSITWDRWQDNWLAALNINRGTNLWCFGTARMFFKQVADFASWRFVQDVIWEKHNGSGFLTDRFRRVHESIYHYVPAGTEWGGIYKSPQFTNDATARTVRKKEKPAHWHGKTGPTHYVSQDGGPRMMRSVWHVRSCHGNALHPTQKPTGVLTPLIEYSCPLGGTVLAPFSGAGSELQAAKETGRAIIGIEIEEKYCEIAANRLRQEVLF